MRWLLSAVEGGVVDDWEDLGDGDDDIKENWDDSDQEVEGEGELEGEEEGDDKEEPVGASPTSDKAPVLAVMAQEAIVADGDSDVIDESESDSESEDESLPAAERQKAKVQLRLQVAPVQHHDCSVCSVTVSFT